MTTSRENASSLMIAILRDDPRLRATDAIIKLLSDDRQRWTVDGNKAVHGHTGIEIRVWGGASLLRICVALPEEHSADAPLWSPCWWHRRRIWRVVKGRVAEWHRAQAMTAITRVLAATAAATPQGEPT